VEKLVLKCGGYIVPLLHCKKCHHEWEGRENSKCDWCGGNSYILEEVTPFERSLESIREVSLCILHRLYRITHRIQF